jgi:purine-binding chemotaxis protein CheW
MLTDTHSPSEIPLLFVHLADQRFGVPLAQVERVMPLAHFLPLPGQADEVVGMFNLHGDVLPVLDVRPRFGITTPPLHAEHSLLLLSGERRVLVWVDRVDDVSDGVALGRVARLGDVLLPLLTV